MEQWTSTLSSTLEKEILTLYIIYYKQNWNILYTGNHITFSGVRIEVKQGPTRHRPMAHAVVFQYLSYSTRLAEHAVHRLRRCPGWDMFVLVCSVRWSVSHLPTGWPHDHGPTNVRAMEKNGFNLLYFHRIGPLGRFGLIVAMSVRPSVRPYLSCPLPMQFLCVRGLVRSVPCPRVEP